jgi:uncharacterized protein (TIGR02996 family)
MNDEQGFLNALTASPGDDTTRLVYADWLDERGDARGEYLRIDCKLADLHETDPRWNSLESRLANLRGAHFSWVNAIGKRYDVNLEGFQPSHSILMIKVARKITSSGTKDMKELVFTLPRTFASGVFIDEARRIRHWLVYCYHPELEEPGRFPSKVPIATATIRRSMATQVGYFPDVIEPTSR